MIKKKTSKENFYAILGKEPSKGARSPKLWNKVLLKLKKTERMIPLDIKEKNLKVTLKKLERNNFFRGGCVTVPYKERILAIIKKNVPKKILKGESINCIFKDKNEKLTGCNTDGLAALYVLNLKVRNLKKKKILIFGIGGAGKAIIRSLINYGCKKIYGSNRSPIKNISLKSLGYSFVPWNCAIKNLDEYDIIVNATSVGFLNKNKCPLPIKLLEKIKNKTFFDIIYQPKETMLLKTVKKNNKTINGLLMNLIQAVLAFAIVTKFKNKNKIIKYMKK